MLRDCWASVRSSSQNATAGSILRRCALVYLPTICVVSVFVALTWLGLSMNNGTFRDKDLVVVITYFAALLVLECILLAQVAICRQRTSRPSPKPSCVEGPAQTTSSSINANVGHPQPENSSVVNLAHVQTQALRPSVGDVMAERPDEPRSNIETAKPPTTSSQNPSLQSHKFPALCQPYHPSTTPETNRPPTAVAYMPQQPPNLLPVSPPTPDVRSSWDLSMASDHQSLAVQPLTSAPPPATTLFQPEASPKASFGPRSSTTSSSKPSSQAHYHQATPSIPETKPPQGTSHISAFPSNAPASSRHKSREVCNRSKDEPARQQVLQSPSQSRGTTTPQAEPQPQPQPHSHSSLLQKNLIALAGT
jgi:hypothetical protein